VMSKEGYRKWDFSSRLNSLELLVLRIVYGNMFYTTGSQTEMAHSSCLVRVLGMTNVGHVDDRSPWR